MTLEEFIRNVDFDSYYEKSPKERLELAQQYENVIAELEHRSPCIVKTFSESVAEARPGLRGYFSSTDNAIYLRPDFFTSRKPKIIGLSKFGMAEMLATLTHEGRHAWQHYVIDHPELDIVDKKTRLSIGMNFGKGYRNGNGNERAFAEYVAQLIEIDARHFSKAWIDYLAERFTEKGGRGYAELCAASRKLSTEEQINAQYISEHFDAAKMMKFEEKLKKQIYPGIDTTGITIFGDAFRLKDTGNIMEFIDCRPVDFRIDALKVKVDEELLGIMPARPDYLEYKPDPFRIKIDKTHI